MMRASLALALLIALPAHAQTREDHRLAQQIYIICEDRAGPCKIGISNNPTGRLRALQTGNSRKLTLYRRFRAANARHLEVQAHRYLAPLKIKSGGDEWFDVSVDEAEIALRIEANRKRAGIRGRWNRMMLRWKLWRRGRVS